MDYKLLKRTGKAGVQTDGTTVNTAREIYRVRTGYSASYDEIVYGGGFYLGMPFVQNTAALLLSAEIDDELRLEPHKSYQLTLDYSSLPQQINNSDDPLDAPCMRKWSSTRGNRTTLFDRNNQLIVNTAGQPYASGIEVWTCGATCTWSRNESTFSGSAAIGAVEAVNSDYFSGAAPGTLMLEISADEQIGKYGVHYWAVQYAMTYNRYGWQPLIYNGGFYELKAGRLVEILRGKFKQPVTNPWPLDSAGAALSEGYDPSSVIFNKVPYYPEIPFSQYNLPV